MGNKFTFNAKNINNTADLTYLDITSRNLSLEYFSIIGNASSNGEFNIGM